MILCKTLLNINYQKLSRFSCHFNLRSMSSLGDKFRLPARYGASEETVWDVFNKFALQHKPLVHLGQGFSDYAPPKHVTDALAEVSLCCNPLTHQYSRGRGHLKLVTLLSKLYSPLIQRELDPLNEILLSAGAYEALFCSFLGHVSEGDEVILIEPFFDCYEAMVKVSGGKPVFIPLKPTKTKGNVSSADWKFDKEQMEKLFNCRTKAIVVNNPNNPVGKVFSLEELTFIADLCKKWNVLCISDEVYEWIIYKPHKHIRMATLPDMWERTITIGSAGKTFSVTGWKVGWAFGPNSLIQNLFTVHGNTVNSVHTPSQEALSKAFEIELARFGTPECYMESLALELLPKRDRLAKLLCDSGMTPTIPDGGYFMMADWSALEDKIDLSEETDKYLDYKLAKWMMKKLKIQAVPPSAFYSEENKPLAKHFLRYCFIKDDETLRKAEELMMNWIKESKK